MSRTKQITVEVWRGREDGAFESYDIDRDAGQTVLDIVTHIQRYIDASLSYRFACRVGVCGSCAMMVNGKPRWTCRTQVKAVLKHGRLSIAPLRNLPVIKDLVTDMRAFFDKWAEAKGRFQPTDPDKAGFAEVSPESPARRAADAGIECIGCAVCYAACDVVAWRPDYLGPAALNRAWTLVNDERDADRFGHLAAVTSGGGCQNCHSHQACASHCPKQLNPTAAIAGLKRELSKAVLRGKL